MNNKRKIQKLPQDLVNQIAAGEVIERPASVVKELLDNSIDAGAAKIKVSIKDGGNKLIEVMDNGIGIPKEDLPLAFQAHTTSKIETIDDLNELISMGFRGEALSTIQSVAKITAISKTENDEAAYKIEIDPENDTLDSIQPQKAAHPQGTTIRVEDLFFNIPARKKYLRKANTEYRKIQQTILPYLLIHPEISFDIYKDGRKVYSVPAIKDSSANTLHALRVKDVLNSSWVDKLIDFYYDGESVKVGGFIAYPEAHTSRTSHEYIFINNRPVYDSGIVRSVLSGFARFIPQGEKIPFMISLQLRPDLVDVNVHPRKEEVRFSNPYRIYQAVEQAVRDALKREIKNERIITNTSLDDESEQSRDDLNYDRLRLSKSSSGEKSHSLFKDRSRANFRRDKSGNLKEIKFNKPGGFQSAKTVKDSLEFTKNLLSSNPGSDLLKEELSDDTGIRSLKQIFNKYILVEFENEIWVVDQHAAAERVTFERLLKSLNEELGATQKLLIPVEIKLIDWQREFIRDNKEFFEGLGFELQFNENKILVKELAVDLADADLQKLFDELFEESSEKSDIEQRFKEKSEDFVATISCHNSIRSGQELNSTVMRKLINDLVQCENPYSCPHGRPAVWRLKLSEIDSNFERTY